MKSPRNWLLAAALMLATTGQVSAQPAPAPAGAPAVASSEATRGKLAWYGGQFAGRLTASGERYDPAALTMAHRTLPFGTRVKVTNNANQRSVVVHVNDRGPFTPGRIGDVSAAAAEHLRMQRAGVIDATLEVVGEAPAGRRP